ncbi:helix-turn-helix domain-containing protein [Serratia marcescens]|uniref:helix-turn-helix domain-containing protein n=1 Tax=Serratia marcescens TaxID=615 RepID=UPI001C2DD021|nr:helix-turn-helix domain-containing protein [Serratia marcescens]
MLNAVAALEEGASVTRVASDLGYDSTSAFISLFQRHFGQTPGCFARSLRLPN